MVVSMGLAVEELKGWIGTKVNGYMYVIDIINACCLRCPTCAVGVLPFRKETGKVMSFDLFRRILDKAQSESKIRKIQLYIYSDPCMHKHLHLFLEECRKRDIPNSISTMLQATNCDFAKVVEARPTEFRVSFAGWRNMSIYQRGGNTRRFLDKLELISNLPRYPETRWTMFYHLYKDNLDEAPLAKKLAEDHGLDFIAYPAIYMINEKVVEKNYTPAELETISHLLETPEENIKRLAVDTQYCQMQRKQVTIDANGDAWLCQIVYEDRFRLAPFLTTSLREIRRLQKAHPFCVKCKAAGGHTYQYLYGDSTKIEDPIVYADKKRFQGHKNEKYIDVDHLSKEDEP
jgi:hypothetical protein